jgi:hypothetical protein
MRLGRRDDAGPGPLTGQGPFDELPVVIDQLGKQPQVHDRAVACRREVDDLADGGGVFVSGDDEGAWFDLAGVAGLVHEGAPRSGRHLRGVRGSGAAGSGHA